MRKEPRAFRNFLKFLGPGFIDPGNWATNISAGADFRYGLLWVITLSTIMLILVQNMSARLGIATGKSLASNIREHFPAPASGLIGATIVAACAATDVAGCVFHGYNRGILHLFPAIPPARAHHRRISRNCCDLFYH